MSSGGSIWEYQPDEAAYRQGSMAGAVFFIENGKVKLTMVSTSGRESVGAILPEITPPARVVWPANRLEWPQQARLSAAPLPKWRKRQS